MSEDPEDLMAESLTALIEAEEAFAPRRPRKKDNKFETHIAPRFAEIREWVHMGLRDWRIAELLCLSLSTFKYWLTREQGFRKLMRRSRKVVDAMVENAMFEKAVGHPVEERTFEPNEEGEMYLSKVVKKHTAPDTPMLKFLSVNLMPGKYREPSQMQMAVATNKTWVELVSTLPCAQKLLEEPEEAEDVEFEEVGEEQPGE